MPIGFPFGLPESRYREIRTSNASIRCVQHAKQQSPARRQPTRAQTRSARVQALINILFRYIQNSMSHSTTSTTTARRSGSPYADGAVALWVKMLTQ